MSIFIYVTNSIFLVCEMLPTGDYLQCSTELSLEVELTYPLTSYAIPESNESVGTFYFLDFLLSLLLTVSIWPYSAHVHLQA